MRPVGSQCASTFISVLLLTLGVHAQTRSLESEFHRLNVTTALFVPSTAVDEKPIWSPDSRFLAVNLMGQWYSFDTQSCPLQQATWHKERIGALIEKPNFEQLDEKTIAEWKNSSKNSENSVRTKSGVEFRFEHKELSSKLLFKPGAGKFRPLWQSEMENCYELAVSPDDHYLAFICEQNGVFVLNIPMLVDIQSTKSPSRINTP